MTPNTTTSFFSASRSCVENGSPKRCLPAKEWKSHSKRQPEAVRPVRMTEQSIAAYDVSQRVKTYDADMELMHPNRSKMVEVAIEVLPFPRTATLRAIDLGTGTGYFTKQFLNHFPNSRVLGISLIHIL